ncbi:MAG: methyltransferase [Chloroflexi bacterium]|nr:methyltransferase [Chloroflexota bacterium]
MARKRTRRRKSRKVASKLAPKSPVKPGLEGGYYKPLTDEEVVQIHEAALTVLERTGVYIPDSECRDILQKAGARVDTSHDRVYYSRELVEQAMKLANRNVVFYGRTPQHDLHLTGNKVYLGTGGAAVKVLDLKTGYARDSVLRDIYDIGRLVDTLHNIHFYLRPVVARDMSNDDIDINTFYACFASTEKHAMGGCYFPEKVAELKKLAVMIAGSEEAFLTRPFLSLTFSFVVSPLRFAPETVETLTTTVRAGIPISMVSAPQSGATSPASLVGTLVQTIAEELAGITYVQLLKPGHPLLMGGMPLVTDLRTGSMVGGSAELALMNAAATQLTHFYDLPIYNTCGITEAKTPDVQAGFEKGMTITATALAGANYNHHAAGMLESLLTVAYEQYVIDDDIGGQVMRLVRGLEVNEETLSLDVIHEAALGEGHYLGHPQTLALMHNEYVYPHTADRTSRANWEEAGRWDMRQIARHKAREILKSHFPTYISPKLDSKIRSQFNILLPQEIMQPSNFQ